MARLRKLISWLQDNVRHLWQILHWRFVADPLGTALWGCFGVGLLLHMPLLAAFVAMAVAGQKEVPAPAWANTVAVVYFVLYAAFALVSLTAAHGYSASAPLVDLTVNVVQQMPAPQMDRQEAEQAVEAAVGVVDLALDAAEIAAEWDERHGRERRAPGEEEE